MEETVWCAATYPSPTYYKLLSLFTLILIHANTLRRESAPMHDAKPCIDLTVWTLRNTRAKMHYFSLAEVFYNILLKKKKEKKKVI